jgi:hypothetical protein
MQSHCPLTSSMEWHQEEVASHLADRSFLQLDKLPGNLLRQVQTELWAHEVAGMETLKQEMQNLLPGSLGEACLSPLFPNLAGLGYN